MWPLAMRRSGQAVVVDVGEHDAPAERIGVDAEACGKGDVVVGSVAVCLR